ncbi:MAG: TonB-dependent receptor plug domain-containing protein [Gilvibacter sp.]
MRQIKGVLIVVFMILSGSSWSQEETIVQPLAQTLDEISEYHDVDFNYDQSVVVNLQTSDINIQDNLPNILAALTRQTGLRFSYLDDNLISVTRANVRLLCGYVKDKETMYALGDATIQTSDRAVTANIDGYFEIEITNPNQIVSVRYLGYKTLNRAYQFFKKDSCESIYIVADQQQLPQIFLQGFLVQGIDKKDDGAVVMDFNRFSILPGVIEADVLQAIQALPGISSINETVSNVNIRGGTHDQNLIMWDDIKMYQSGHFFGLISVFNPQMNQKVTLTKNGTQSSYTDGVSGTIAMSTSQRLNTHLKANVGVNLVNADAFMDLPIGSHSSLQVAGRKSLSDFVKTPTYERYFDRIAQDTEVQNNTNNAINSEQEFDFYDLSLRWLYQISDSDLLRLNFLVINNQLVFTESDLVDEQLESRESSVQQNSIAAGLFYSRKWNELWESSIQAYNTDYTLKAINANVSEQQRFLQENSVSETGIRAQTSYLATDRINTKLGYQFVETKITNLDDVDNPIFRSLSGEVVRTHSGFLAGIFKNETSNTRLELGSRYIYIPKFDTHLIEPRLNFNQGITPEVTVEVLGEFKSQITSQIINFQNDFLGIEKRRWQLSDNDSIPIIESKQASVGLSFHPDSWLINIEGYYKQVDGITTQSQGFLNQFRFAREAGSYTATGIDVLLRKNIWRLNLWASYSFLESDYTFKTLSTTEFANNFRISHASSVGCTYDHKNLRLSVGVNYHSGRPFTMPDAQLPVANGGINYDFPNSALLIDYLRLDASAIYTVQFKKTRLQIAAALWNVLNKENILDSYYQLDANLETAERVDQRSLGLTPNASLRYYF